MERTPRFLRRTRPLLGTSMAPKKLRIAIGLAARPAWNPIELETGATWAKAASGRERMIFSVRLFIAGSHFHSPIRPALQ